MSLISLDPQAIGWQDDGSEAGVLRTQINRGDLVPVPFSTPTSYWLEQVGAGFATYTSGSLPENLDGTATGLKLSVAHGLNNGVRVWYPFRGRVFGLRWLAKSSQTAGTSVTVDGVSVSLGDPIPQALVAEGMTTQLGTELGAVLFDDLPPGPHLAEIVMTSDPVVDRALQLHGLLLDARAGYRAPTQGVAVLDSAACPTSATRIASGLNERASAVRKVIYLNTGASPATVTVLYSAAPIWMAAIQPNETATFDPGGLLSVTTQHTHQASAAGVTATVLGGR